MHGENRLDHKNMGPLNSTNAIDLLSCNTKETFASNKKIWVADGTIAILMISRFVN